MRSHWRRIVAISVVSTALLSIVLGPGAAFAEASREVAASAPPDASVLGFWGEAEDTCEEGDDATDPDLCAEADDNAGETTGEESQQGDDACDEVEGTTDPETCAEVDKTSEGRGRQGEMTNQNNRQHTSNQSPDIQGRNQKNSSENANNQGTNNARTSKPNADGPLARVGRWVLDLTDRLGEVVGGLVGRLAELVGSGGDATKASHRSPNADSEDAAGIDRSGESASTRARKPEQRRPRASWWEAWLPFTGWQWLLLAVAAALVLIAAGVALKSRRRRGGFPRVGQV
jgi:hypothetical protein